MRSRGPLETDSLVRRGAASTVASLFTTPVQLCPERLALVDGQRKITYARLSDRVRRLAAWLSRHGVGQGTRIAILSENRLEYIELFLAAAWLGAVVACQNWRLAPPELAHCLRLAEPEVMMMSPRHAALAARTGVDIPTSLILGEAYETAVAESGPDAAASPAELDPESPLLILYTSGTTGLPKGAVISHRAEIARNMVLRAEFGIAPTDAYVAWSPLYHMGGAEYSLSTLMTGGTVFVVDGFDADRLVTLVASEAM